MCARRRPGSNGNTCSFLIGVWGGMIGVYDMCRTKLAKINGLMTVGNCMTTVDMRGESAVRGLAARRELCGTNLNRRVVQFVNPLKWPRESVGTTVSMDGTDPYMIQWGSLLEFDPAIADATGKDDSMVGTTFMPSGSVNYAAETDLAEVVGSCSSGIDDKKVLVEGLAFPEVPLYVASGQAQGIKAEEGHIIENAIENFLNFEFYVEKTSRLKNKPYEVHNNTIFARRQEAIKIKVVGADEGHVIKMTMRYKTETHYHQPVVACRSHSAQAEQNMELFTFSLVPKSPVKYTLEKGHPTAFLEVPMLTHQGFGFYPVFCCWNFCDKNFGRKREMILTVCDAKTLEELHTQSFDVRICQNVGRDLREHGKPKALKRLNNTGKKRRLHGTNAEVCKPLQVMEINQAVPVPSPSTLHFMMEADPKAMPVLKWLVEMGLIKLTETASLVCLPESHGH